MQPDLPWVDAVQPQIGVGIFNRLTVLLDRRQVVAARCERHGEEPAPRI
jgi:hypothetical protein